MKFVIHVITVTHGHSLQNRITVETQAKDFLVFQTQRFNILL